MNSNFKKPLSRSKTPPPRRNPENIARTAPLSQPQQRVTGSNDTPLSHFLSSRLPSRIAKSENDLSTQRKQTKSKDVLSKADELALSYNAYLQTCLMAMYDERIQHDKEREVISIMENQQSELMKLEEEDNYLDMVLMKVKLFKQIRENILRETEFLERIVESIPESKLDSQIEMIENNINRILLNNFKLPETDEEKNMVFDCLKKIGEELKALPEFKNKVQPLNDMCSSLLKAKELNDEIGVLKKQCADKLKQAEDIMYEEFYLKTKIASQNSEFESNQQVPIEEGTGDNSVISSFM